MYCKKCLGTITEDEKFCTSCGAPIEGREVINEEIEVETVDEPAEEINVTDTESNTLVTESELRSEMPILNDDDVTKDNPKKPMIHLDPKTGESIMPDDLEEVKAAEKVEEVPEIQTKVPPVLVREPKVEQVNNVYKKASTTSMPNQNPKPVVKTAELILGIIGVALSFISSIASGLFYIGFASLGSVADGGDVGVSSGRFFIGLTIMLVLKGFIFAFIGLVGVLKIKKNSQVAGLFLLSAAIGSILTFQLIRGGLFLIAGIISLTRHEKTDGPIMKHIIVAFLPTAIVLIILLITLIAFGLSDMGDTVDTINSVYRMSQVFI